MNPNDPRSGSPYDVTTTHNTPVMGWVTGDWVQPPAPPRPAPPPQPFGAYDLLGEVARGGMGVVYKARQRELDRVVALKMVSCGDPRRPAAVERFLQEAKAAAALDHPNVVPVYDAGEVGGRLFFTMALVDGPDLRRFVEVGGVPPLATAVRLFAAITAGVAHAHRHGIVHRDLKPANVMIDQDGRPRVTDFGLAKWSARDSQLTGAGQVMGTPAYMAPEQAREAKDVGPAADVYALGGVLYFLLTGRAPFGAGSVAELLMKVMTESPAPPRDHAPAVPPDVEAVCLRCLAKAPGDRYADAQVLLDDVVAIAERYVPRSSEWKLRSSAPPRAETPPVDSPHASGTKTAPARDGGRSRPRGWGRTALGAGAALVALASGLRLVRPWEEPPGGPPAPPPPAHPGPPAETEWDVPATGKLGLSVRMTAAAGRDDSGRLLIPEGVGTMKLRLRADVDCAAAVFNIAPDGVITRLFPNDHDADARLAAGRERLIPPDNRYTLDSNPTLGSGFERLRVVATTGELARLPAGQRVGPFVQYSADADRRRVEETFRGFTVGGGKPAGPDSKTADAVVAFRVTPR